MSQKAYKSGSSFPDLKEGTVRVYSSRMCPFAERPLLVLAHKNIPHEVININLSEKPDWFLSLSPAGKVPVVQVDDKILNESTAVSEYLDDVYPGDRLQASDPYRKAEDRILLESLGQVGVRIYGIVFRFGKEDKKEEIEANIKLLHQSYKFYEEELEKRNSCFWGGSSPGMFDFYMWPFFERIPAVAKLIPTAALDKSDYPRMTEWWEAMTQVPAVKGLMHDADWHSQIYKLRIEGKPYNDYGLDE